MTRTQANLLLLLAAAIWGIAFYFQKTAMDEIGPLMFIAGRALLATLALVPIAIIEARWTGVPWSPQMTRYSIISGLLFYVGAILHQAGFMTSNVINGGFLTTLYVLVTPLLSLFVLKRKPPVYVWPALALALAGVWLLGGGSFDGFVVGDGLIVLSAVFWGGMMLVASLASEAGRPITYTMIQFGLATVIAFPVALAFEPVDFDAVWRALPAMAFVGVLSSAVTFSLFSVALRYTTASEGVIVLSTEVLFAAAAGAILLGERLSLVGWVGAGLMFLATLLVQLGPAIRRRFRPRPAT